MNTNIEALVKKHIKFVCITVAGNKEMLRNALTEQAETHAMELRAYEATVQNLEQRIRDLEKERVPEWQPIETAPNNELILIGPTKRMGVCVGMNHSFEGWVTETPSDWVSIYAPTHWMPLPAAPKKEGE